MQRGSGRPVDAMHDLGGMMVCEEGRRKFEKMTEGFGASTAYDGW